MKRNPFVPDQNNPTVIKMWKLQGAEPLVNINQHYKLHYTNAPINFDLLAGKIVPAGGDIKLTVTRSPGIMSGRNRLSTNFNEHFIFCGAQVGSAQIDLQVLDNNGNVLADAPTYLQINDIKQMYERWTVGEDPKIAPTTVATYQVDDFAFRYTPPQNTNTPYILFVHGWNLETWEKDRFAETAFKRLYWQGVSGTLW